MFIDCRVIHVFLGVLTGSLLQHCQGVHRPPIVRRLHHKPHHAKFSADPAPCPCITNGQPVIQDGFLKDSPVKGNHAMSGPIIKGLDVNGSETYFPAEYGNRCESWDRITDPVCKKELPPAYCSTRWCFVAPECAKPDTQKTWRFPGSELYFSYEACGSFDSVSTYKCHDHSSESECVEDMQEAHYRTPGPRCAWTKKINDEKLPASEQMCQPDRCQCNGEHLPSAGVDEKKSLYGTHCDAWDRKNCETWQDHPDAKMGIWCCQSWCYVDSSCPSAAPSVDLPGLYWSYAACQDDLEEIKTCPWSEATGWQGSPALLSDETREALAKHEPKPKETHWTDNVYLWVGIPLALIIVIGIIFALGYCCCRRSS